MLNDGTMRGGTQVERVGEGQYSLFRVSHSSNHHSILLLRASVNLVQRSCRSVEHHSGIWEGSLMAAENISDMHSLHTSALQLR